MPAGHKANPVESEVAQACACLGNLCFTMKKVCYLGGIVGELGVYVYPNKIQVICVWPMLINLTEFPNFLALVNCHY